MPANSRWDLIRRLRVNLRVLPLAVQKHLWCYMLDVLNQKSHKKQLRSAGATSAAHGSDEEPMPL